MIVPAFWAEGRLRQRKKDGQVTIRRFGWSDESQEAAQRHADERTREAFERFQRGERAITRAEYKATYNGSQGLPIREEIVERIGATIVTRNGYGALCLNTPNVLFADVDVATGGFRGWLRDTFGFWLRLLAPALAEDPWVAAERRVRTALAARGDGRFRIYRTPAGFRVLAMHRTFESDAPEVTELFSALGVDRIYARMCALQRCFRARVSPKPWRIGVTSHIKPARSTWPVKEMWMEGRRAWVAEYERRSSAYASCRFVDEVGMGRTDDVPSQVARWHDDMCRAKKDLPLA